MLSKEANDLQDLIDFLRLPTPKAWLNAAMANLPLLLLDHAHCERKAAATALNFMAKYPEKPELIAIMSPLAREELLHFEKVIALMRERHISFGPLPPSAYAQHMHRFVTKGGCTQRLCDQLIIGAIIEARSCERFFALTPLLAEDVQLFKFYRSLIKSEARHFQDYLSLAKQYGGNMEQRIDFFIQLENQAIAGEDEVFRFHSGIPHIAIKATDPSEMAHISY